MGCSRPQYHGSLIGLFGHSGWLFSTMAFSADFLSGLSGIRAEANSEHLSGLSELFELFPERANDMMLVQFLVAVVTASKPFEKPSSKSFSPFFFTGKG